MITYDPAVKALLLFGGLRSSGNNTSALSETWTYRGGNWTNWTAIVSASPAPTFGAAMVYDAADRYVVLVGGSLGAATWVFSHGTWTSPSIPLAPPARWAPALTYDPNIASVILFSGAGSPTRLWRDTWEFAGGNWSSLTNYYAVRPSGRMYAGFVWDIADNYSFLWGGVAGVGSPAGPYPANDSWAFGPRILASLRSSAPVADVGQSLRFVARAVALTQPLTYNFTGLPPGCGTASPGQTTVTCSPSTAGSYSIRLTAADPAGDTARASVALQMNRALRIVGLNASSTSLDLGSSWDVAVKVTGGTAPFSFNYSQLPPGCATSDSPSLSCQPQATGAYNVTVRVADAVGVNRSASLLVTVHAAFRLPGLKVSPAAIDLGLPTAVSASPAGGAAPYRFAFTGLPVGCHPPDNSTGSFTCRPQSTGSFRISVDATDSTGSTANGSASLLVAPDPQLAVNGSAQQEIDRGQTATFRFNVSGGLAPFVFRIPGLPSECTATFPQLVCQPAQPETLNLNVTVSDAGGGSASTLVALVVTPLPRVVNASVFPSSSDVGTPIEVRIGVTGGAAPLQFEYRQLPTGCAAQDLSVFNCTPSGPSSWDMLVTVTDAVGVNTTGTVHLEIHPRPTLQRDGGAIVAAPFGRPMVVSVSVAGGTAPFVFSYLHLPRGCASTDGPSLNCTPSTPGAYFVEAVAQDAVFVNCTTNFTLIALSPMSPPPPAAPPLWETVALGGLAGTATALAVVLLWPRRTGPRSG